MPPALRRCRSRSLLACALFALTTAPVAALAQATGVLTDDVSPNAESSMMNGSFGPGGLLALAEENQVTVWNTTSRRLLARVALTPDGSTGTARLPTRIQRASFTLDGRLVIATSQGLEVVSLRDTRVRQVMTLGVDMVQVMTPTPDGVVMGFSSGRVVQLAGTPLVEQARFRLPSGAERIGSIAVVGDRTFVASAGRLFVYSAGTVQEVPIGGTGGHRDLAVGAGRSGEIVVAGGSHLARVSAQTHAVLGNATSQAGETYRLSVTCNPEAQLCYWRRGDQVEVWRDDLSERMASGEVRGLVDAMTGRTLERAPTTNPPAPGATPTFMLASSVGGPAVPLGARLAEVNGGAWASRDGELILAVAERAYALRLADLALTPIGETFAPVAVGSDGRVLTTGRLGEVVVHSAELAVQRTVFAGTCNVARIRQLTNVDSESAWQQLTRLERQCEDSAPSHLATSPTGTLVAMDTPNGDLRWLDYQRGRWLERAPDFASRGDGTNVTGLTWVSGSDAVTAYVGDRRYTVPRRGEVTSVEDVNGPPTTLARPATSNAPTHAATVVDGRLVVRRLADGAELTLTFVAAHPAPLIIARTRERFWAPAEVRHLVHQQLSTFDALAPELPSDSVLDPQVVTTVMVGAR